MAFVPRIHIHNLGPIEDCVLPIFHFTELNYTSRTISMKSSKA